MYLLKIFCRYNWQIRLWTITVNLFLSFGKKNHYGVDFFFQYFYFSLSLKNFFFYLSNNFLIILEYSVQKCSFYWFTDCKMNIIQWAPHLLKIFQDQKPPIFKVLSCIEVLLIHLPMMRNACHTDSWCDSKSVSLATEEGSIWPGISLHPFFTNICWSTCVVSFLQ